MPYLVMKRREECMTVDRILMVGRVMGSMMWTLTAFSKPFSVVVVWGDTLAWEVITVGTTSTSEEVMVEDMEDKEN